MTKHTTVRAYSPHIVPYLGKVYRTKLAALLQAVENAVDAVNIVLSEYPYPSYEPTVVICLNPKFVSVTDNGQGMNPYMTSDDEQFMTEVFAEAEKGILPDFDIKERVSRASRYSLAWMVKCVGISPKDADKNVKGLLGIGSLAWMTYADDETIYTRAIRPLAENFEGGEVSEEDRTVSVLRVHMQNSYVSAEDPDVAEDQKMLCYPDETALDHGTRIIFSGLHSGVEDFGKLNKLIATLSRSFANDIQERGIRIYIVDQITEEGKKKTGGEIYEVHEPLYTGEVIFNTDDTPLSIDDGTPFNARLYYDPSDQDTSPDVRRKQGGVIKLVQLEGFEDPVWKRIGGFIEFPNADNQRASWGTAKDVPTGPTFSLWKKVVNKLGVTLETRIKNFEEQVTKKQRQGYGRDLLDAVRRAMHDIAFFQDEGFGPQPTEPSHKGEGQKRRTLQNVAVSVLDEHNIGISGIAVTLLSGTKVLTRDKTLRAGYFNFGRRPGGTYTLVVNPPAGMRVDGKDRFTFTLTNAQPGYQTIFHLITGRPKRSPNSTIVFEPTFEPFYQTPDKPWRQSIKLGIIAFNTIASDLKQADEDGDDVRYDALIARYTEAAIGQYYVEEGEEHPPEEGSLLFAKIFAYLRGNREVAKKNAAKEKRKSQT